MRNAKEVEQRLIDLRRENKYTYEEIAELLDRSVSYVRGKCITLMKQGRIERLRTGKKPVVAVIEIDPVKVITEKSIGCSCEYPMCTFPAKFNFSLVPLCKGHYEIITEESAFYYSVEDEGRKPKRKHWAKISQRSAELWVSQKGSTYTQPVKRQKESR